MNFIKNTWNNLFKKQQQANSKNYSSNLEVGQKKQVEQQIPDEIVQQLFNLSSELAKHSKNISDDGIKLKIYAYYKQSTIGDCNTEKPQIFDLMGRTKWNAWDQMRGVSKKQAKMEYVRIVSQADPKIQNQIHNKLMGQQPKAQVQENKPKQLLGYLKAQPTIYTYTHPYFKLIQLGQQILSISHEQLLIKNNEPEVYPLHFAIDKQQIKFVKLFLEMLKIQQIESMQDSQGIGILQYAELIQNEQILELVRNKLGK